MVIFKYQIEVQKLAYLSGTREFTPWWYEKGQPHVVKEELSPLKRMNMVYLANRFERFWQVLAVIWWCYWFEQNYRKSLPTILVNSYLYTFGKCIGRNKPHFVLHFIIHHVHIRFILQPYTLHTELRAALG